MTQLGLGCEINLSEYPDDTVKEETPCRHFHQYPFLKVQVATRSGGGRRERRFSIYRTSLASFLPIHTGRVARLEMYQFTMTKEAVTQEKIARKMHTLGEEHQQ